MKYYEIYDELTNKTLHIQAPELEEAIAISETLDFNNFNDGDHYES